MSSQENQKEQARKLLRAITEIDDRFLMEAMRADEESGKGESSETSVSGKDGSSEVSVSGKGESSETPVSGKDGSSEVSVSGKGESSETSVSGKDGSSEVSVSGKGESSETSASGKIGSSEVSASGKDESSEAARFGKEDTSYSGTKRQGRKLRRYSTWALTAAACLAVIVIGRYVSVNNVKNASVRPAAVLEEKEQVEADQKDQGEADQKEQADAGQNGPAEAGQGNQNTGTAKKTEEKERIIDVDETPLAMNSAGEVSMAEDTAGEVSAAEDTAGEVSVAEDTAGKVSAAEDTAGEAPVAEDTAGEVSAAEDTAAEISMAEEPAAENFTADESAAADSAGSSGHASRAAGAAVMPGMLNPFIDTDTLEEAEEAAGFPIILPSLDASGDKLVYRAMTGKMIEVIYRDEYNREEYRIRKGLNMEDDISGVVYEYAETNTLETGNGIEVTVYGEDAEGDQWGTAVWTREEGPAERYSYSIDNGRSTFSTKEILTIVEEMTAGAQDMTE